MSDYLLSVILPARGIQKSLNEFLDALLKSRDDDTWELIVIDDFSDEPLSIDHYKKKNWKLFRAPEILGAAAARNYGAEQATGKHLVFLSLFLSVPENYIHNIKLFIENNTFDFAQHLIKKAPDIKATHFQKYIANQESRLKTNKGAIEVKQSLFTAALVKRNIFEQLGGFDSSMNHYGGHELDLVYRMEKAGFNKRILIPGITLHRTRLEEHRTIQARLREYGQTGLANLLNKHPELKETILTNNLMWKIISSLGLSRVTEKVIYLLIEMKIPKIKYVYRLYLHLIVRNAWDAR